MERIGTHCPIDNDHAQHFDLSDLNNGIYNCDTCKRPLMALIDGNLHNVQPLATIQNVE